MQIPLKLILGLFSFAVWGQASFAMSEPVSVERTCQDSDHRPVCIIMRTEPNRTLRAMRLQEAIDNGDLTQEEAKVLLKHRKWRRHQASQQVTSSVPTAWDSTQKPDGDGQTRLYWRNERRRLSRPLSNQSQ